MAAVSGPLSSEPSDPLNRKEHHLPPKSYVDAVEENLQGPSSNGGIKVAPDLYAGHGEDDTLRAPKRSKNSKSPSQRMNGTPRKSGRRVVIERFTDRDGEHLVSLEPEGDPAQRRMTAARRTNSELLSGRKAGARWSQSP